MRSFVPDYRHCHPRAMIGYPPFIEIRVLEMVRILFRRFILQDLGRGKVIEILLKILLKV